MNIEEYTAAKVSLHRKLEGDNTFSSLSETTRNRIHNNNEQVNFPSKNTSEILDVEDEKKYEYKECGKVHSKLRYLQDHSVLQHKISNVAEKRKVGRPRIRFENAPRKRKEVYKCQCCDEVLVTIPTLREHMITKHHGEYHYHCQECDKTFLTPLRLNDHRRKVHVKIRKSICQQCGKSYKDLHALKRHISCYHNIEKKFSCDFCNTKFKMKYSLVAHRKSIHGDGVHEYCCGICQKTFMSQINLERHKRNVHYPKVVGTCKRCGKTFSNEANVKVHMEAVHGTERKFVCKACGAAFKRKPLLNEHDRFVHKGERKHTCPYVLCGKAFQKSSHLNKHVQCIHEKLDTPSKKVSTIEDYSKVKRISATDETIQEGRIKDNIKITKAVILSTNGHSNSVTSFDALRAIHSYLYEFEQSESEAHCFIDVRQFPYSVTDSNPSCKAFEEGYQTSDDFSFYQNHTIGNNIMITSMVHPE